MKPESKSTKIAHSEEAYIAISELAKLRSAIAVLQLVFDPRKLPAVECLWSLVQEFEAKIND